MFIGYAVWVLPICKVCRSYWFIILAYQANEQGKQIEMIIYGALAILFQPFFKIALGREIWNIVDVIVGIGLILSIWISPKKAQR